MAGLRLAFACTALLIAVVPTECAQDTFTSTTGLRGNFKREYTQPLQAAVAAAQQEPSAPSLPTVSPLIAEKMKSAAPDERIPVLLVFEDNMPTEQLRSLHPNCDPTAPRSSKACTARTRAAQAVADFLAKSRLQQAQDLLADVAKVPPSEVTDAFAIVPMVEASLTVGEIQAAVAAPLTSDGPRLVRVDDPDEPAVRTDTDSGLCPYTDGNPSNDPARAKELTTAGAFQSAGSTGFVGVVDAAINPSHVLLEGRLRYLGDCNPTRDNATRNPNCCRRLASDGTLIDPCQNPGNPTDGGNQGNIHGTACSALVGANNNCGGQYSGMTSLQVDFFKAFTVRTVIAAFQAAILSSDVVLSLSLTFIGFNEAHSVAIAADAAFDAGLIVIASAGNSRCSIDGRVADPSCSFDASVFNKYAGTCYFDEPPNSVWAPAIAHKVIAVGAYDPTPYPTSASLSFDLRPICYSSKGPSSDGRVKPDVLGPANIETAYSFEDDGLSIFPATSSATPIVAGTAAAFIAFRNAHPVAGVAPSTGEYMASIIAGGVNYNADRVDQLGAGAYRPGFVNNTLITSGGENTWGTITFTQSGEQVTVGNILVKELWRTVRCAIWWPESAAQAHSYFSLTLLSAQQRVLDTSEHPGSVWQKVDAQPITLRGTWSIRIEATSLSVQQQNVHYFCFH